MADTGQYYLIRFWLNSVSIVWCYTWDTLVAWLAELLECERKVRLVLCLRRVRWLSCNGSGTAGKLWGSCNTHSAYRCVKARTTCSKITFMHWKFERGKKKRQSFFLEEVKPLMQHFETIGKWPRKQQFNLCVVFQPKSRIKPMAGLKTLSKSKNKQVLTKQNKWNKKNMFYMCMQLKPFQK